MPRGCPSAISSAEAGCNSKFWNCLAGDTALYPKAHLRLDIAVNEVLRSQELQCQGCSSCELLQRRKMTEAHQADPGSTSLPFRRSHLQSDEARIPFPRLALLLVEGSPA